MELCASFSSAVSLFRSSSLCCAGLVPSSSSLQRSLRSQKLVLNAAMEVPVPGKHGFYTVGDFMTPKGDLITAKATTSVDEAIELLVQNRITGLPVVDETGKAVGVVSDFDLLALDSISGNRPSNSSLFPEPGSTWKAFKEIQMLISKTHGKTVEEVMTPSPLVVQENSNFEDAARLLLETQKRRLPVVNEDGKLVGLLTRGNVIKAALCLKREFEMGGENE
ncbi:hypothetical protein GOP47_0010476 [Adiantum capillus-veneris]|uniref:CBS domain-containing protein n=1 Tax=Adiantum capillus-veneris TaxID=13818 RepID=A0A9D4ZIU0_ADICA|nr:hypothetical protein GOP47_0010476 [Adiantum capillus-veneris]